MIAASLAPLVAAIPAPPGGNSVEIGPLTFRFYGLMIALGVLAAVEISRRRWAARGGDPDDMVEIAKWGVPAGLIGSRIYHVITDWKMYFSSEGSLEPIDALLIWKGGLGIPGGLILGLSVGAWAVKRRGLDLGAVSDAVIPGVPVAQAIGRLGNWFNQEIFGPPTDLPWALEVDPEFRPAEYADEATFHPTFLYEGLWNLGLAGALIWIGRRFNLRKGSLMPLYMIGYGIGRFLVEGVRIDEASQILGIRVNHWMSGLAVLVGLLWFFWLQRQPESQPPQSSETDPAEDTDPQPTSDPKAGSDELTAAEALAAVDEAEPSQRLFGTGGASES